MEKDSKPDPPEPESKLPEQRSGLTAFWQELKRRKVMRVAGVYAIVSWIIIQVSATVFPQFEIPMWATRLVTLLLVIGFPIAVIIAWAFELSPDGIRKTPDANSDTAQSAGDSKIQKKRNRVAYAFGAIVPAFIVGVVLTIAIVKFTSKDNTGIEMDKSIAVLPFTNMSADDEHAYFADGVHETIITDLSNLRELRVVSRTSVLPFRQSNKSVKLIGQELGVAHLLEGSMQRSGNRFRLSAQLVDCSTDQNLWSQNFDGELDDIFAVQSELAKDIAAALKAVLSPQEELDLDRPATASIAAYELYLKARTTGIRVRLPILEQAVELDPQFTDAWLFMANTIGFNMINGIEGSPELERKAKHAIEMAVKLEPDNPDVLVELGYYYYQCHLDYSRARFYVEKVAERLPLHSDAQLLLGAINRREGRWTESFPHWERAALLDPNSDQPFRNASDSFEYLREWEKAASIHKRWVSQRLPAIVTYREIRNDFFANGPQAASIGQIEKEELNRYYFTLLYITGNLDSFEDEGIIDSWKNEDFRGYFTGQPIYLHLWQQAIVLKLSGETEMAEEILKEIFREVENRRKSFYGDFRGQIVLGFAYALSDEPEKAQAAIDSAIAMRTVSQDAFQGSRTAAERAIVMAWIGKKDEAVRELTRLSKIPNYYTNYYQLKHSLDFYPLRDHPGFQELLNDPALKEPIPID